MQDELVMEHESTAPKVADVPVDHPQIVSAIRTGIKNGWNNETICRVVGMPQEVVDRHRALVRKESQGR